MFTRAKLFLSRHFKQLFYGFNEVRRVQLFSFLFVSESVFGLKEYLMVILEGKLNSIFGLSNGLEKKSDRRTNVRVGSYDLS